MTLRATLLFNDGGTGTGTTSISATLPGTVQAGDVIVIAAGENTGSNTFSISGGGTGIAWHLQSGPDDNQNTDRSYLWTATAVADSAGKTITITTSGGGRFVGIGRVESAVLESGLIFSLTPPSNSGAAFPSVTIPDNSGWTLIAVGVARASSSPGATITAGTGATVDGQAILAASTLPNYTAFTGHPNSVTVGSGSQSPGSFSGPSLTNVQAYTVALAPGQTDNTQQIPTAFAIARSAAPSVTADTVLAVPSAAVGAASGGAQPGTTIPVASAFVGAAADSPAVAASSSPAIPSAAVGASAGQSPTALVLNRFQVWTGTAWKPITPLVWDGTGWQAIKVTITPPLT